MDLNFSIWTPKIGKMNVTILIVAFSVCVSVVLAYALKSFGADATIAAPAPAFDVKGLLMVLIPTLWASVGPLVLAGLTKTINSTVGSHVPHGLQVIISAILGAAAAALGDGGVTIAATAVSGAASQAYAGSQPSTFLTEKQL